VAHSNLFIYLQVQKVLPEAVSSAGVVVLPSGRRIDDFLVVNKDRIFMENLGAVKELCKVTDKLESRIGNLEKLRTKRVNSLSSADSGKIQGLFIFT